jgi:hypothetical protein
VDLEETPGTGKSSQHLERGADPLVGQYHRIDAVGERRSSSTAASS